MKTLPALFIGRFQPFHLGHLDALKQIFKREKRVIIAIGSAKNRRSKKNPFIAGERYEMIGEAVRRYGKKIIIIPVRDINNDKRWVSHMKASLPPFGAVYTGSPIVKKLFEEDGRHKVIPIRIRKEISGTQIRHLMQTRKKWGHLVPSKIVQYIKKCMQ